MNDPLVMALTAHGQVLKDLVWALKHARTMALTCEQDDAGAFWAELELRIKDNDTLDSANKEAWSLRARPMLDACAKEAGI
jgi:hypothetical protein